MKLGEISKYYVLRETDLGYMLREVGKEEDEEFPDGIFLHRNETDFKRLSEGDRVEAFLYMDKQKRVAATLYKPFITVNKGALCEVVSTTSAGAFFNIGISKDILMSSDDFSSNERPLRGDKLPVKLRLRGNSIYIKLLNKEQMLEMNDGYKYEVNQKAEAYVYRITKDGINLVDEHYNIFFIHKNNLRDTHRLGEKVTFTVTGLKEQETFIDYYGTTIQSKENILSDDCDRILKYLNEHHGVMNYTEDTDPLVIEKVFNMSKSAYKRALGHLYKEKTILILNNKICLTRK